MTELRHAVGLRKLALPETLASKPKAGTTLLPSFKQYREADGQFYFKLLNAEGKMLVQSLGFASGKEAATAIASLRQQGAAGWPAIQNKVQQQSEVGTKEIESALELLIDSVKTR